MQGNNIMRILQVNKYLYRRAGAEAYVLDLAELLTEHGHEVGLWGSDENEECRMKNVECFKGLLVGALNFDKREGLWRDIKKVGHMIWSPLAARKFEKVLQKFKPDVVHIHNIYHHISPSILSVAHKYKVPVVMTVHDYHLINPNYSLYDHGKICERRGIAAIAHKCIKDSYSASFADVIEWGVHRMLRVYEKNVVTYIVPTGFVKKKLMENGMEEKEIVVVPLPQVVSSAAGRVAAYVLFAGRVTAEKGIYLLLEIAKLLPEIEFRIAGRGPEIESVECRIKNEALRNVELLGFLAHEELQSVLAGARLVLVPSLWYDPSPFAVLEAQAAGKVVLASQIGGIENLIEDGKTGLLGKVGEAKSWVEKIKKIYYDETRLKQIGEAARKYIKTTHDPEKHYEALMKIYKEVL